MKIGIVSSSLAAALVLTFVAAPDAAASKEKFERDKPHVAVDAAAAESTDVEKHPDHRSHADDGGCCQKHRAEHDREHGCKMMADGEKEAGCKMMAEGNKAMRCKEMAAGKEGMACNKLRAEAEEQADQTEGEAAE